MYLGGSVRVDRYHVLNALLDLELDVELPLQGGNALLVGRRPTLGPGRLRALVCKREERSGSDIKRKLLRGSHDFQIPLNNPAALLMFGRFFSASTAP